jgi:hypothetical protein
MAARAGCDEQPLNAQPIIEFPFSIKLLLIEGDLSYS